MELQYYGANCVRIAGKKAAVTIDDNLSEVGLKSVTKPGDIVVFGGPHKDSPKDPKLVIDQPGEYEVSDISIQGIAARAHMDEAGQLSATMFKIIADDVRIAVVGHIYPELSDKQLEAFGTIDILIIPVGGNGYTLDPVGALKVIKKIEPKLVIPTHYADKAVKYEVPQQELEVAIKELAMEPKETIDKLKLKASDFISDVTQLVILNRS
ncbi:MAG TPA: MBL fold metallo-hydrolase [Candidatus Saccharimonadales bacterium]|nr:MBL fold metallo-hydrolase [Candidatus Saccharimonadales bacterium]